MMVENDTSKVSKTPFFNIIDERRVSQRYIHSMKFLSEISENIILPYDKMYNNPRLATNNTEDASTNNEHIHVIAKNRQQKFENRINWYLNVKENKRNQSELTEYQIELENKVKKEIDIKKRKIVEAQMKKIEQRRQKLIKEKERLDEMQKEDKLHIHRENSDSTNAAKSLKQNLSACDPVVLR